LGLPISIGVPKMRGAIGMSQVPGWVGAPIGSVF
jgi:hypothetical protein